MLEFKLKKNTRLSFSLCDLLAPKKNKIPFSTLSYELLLLIFTNEVAIIKTYLT